MHTVARLTRVASVALVAFGLVQVAIGCADDPTSAPGGSPNVDSGINLPSDPGRSDAGGDSGNDPEAIVDADLTRDFSKTSNPNGGWTFGYMRGVPGADAGALVVFTGTRDVATNVPSWIDPANQVLGDPCVYRNETSAVFADGIEPGEVALHPGNAGEYAIARFTAPSAGTYSVTVQFKAGDTGDTDGLFLHNGNALVTETTTSTNTVHDLVVVAAAGDTLDVAVGHKGDFLDDSTPVVFKIRSSPK